MLAGSTANGLGRTGAGGGREKGEGNEADYANCLPFYMADDESNSNVFISWSGERSKRVASALYEWLPKVVADANPWMSTEDIAKGSSWSNEINTQLGKCKICIVVLTNENSSAPWVMFEAGAIFKSFGGNQRVCTLLCDFDPPVLGPLGQFQATRALKEDIKRMCESIGEAINDSKMNRFASWFEMSWTEFDKEFKSALEATKPAAGPVKEPSQKEMLVELLSTVRQIREAQSDQSRRSNDLGDMISAADADRMRLIWADYLGDRGLRSRMDDYNAKMLQSQLSDEDVSAIKSGVRAADMKDGDRVWHHKFGLAKIMEANWPSAGICRIVPASGGGPIRVRFEELIRLPPMKTTDREK